MPEWLAHPLVLLLVTAVVTGWLVPLIARRWQDERKALTVKVDLVERVVTAVSAMAMASQFASVGAVSLQQKDFDEAYRTWQREKLVLGALLTAYFRDAAVDRSWTRCRALTTAYYVQVGISDEERRTRYLRSVGAGLRVPEPVDLSEAVPDAQEVAAVPPDALDLTDRVVLRAEIDAQLNCTVRTVVAARVSVAS